MAETTVLAPRSTSDLDGVIGARVRALRLERGLSQTALAEAVGISFQQIQKYERGTNRVSVATFIGLAQALEMAPADLLLSIVGGAGVVAEPPVPRKLARAVAGLSPKQVDLLADLAEGLQEASARLAVRG